MKETFSKALVQIFQRLFLNNHRAITFWKGHVYLFQLDQVKVLIICLQNAAWWSFVDNAFLRSTRLNYVYTLYFIKICGYLGMFLLNTSNCPEYLIYENADTWIEVQLYNTGRLWRRAFAFFCADYQKIIDIIYLGPASLLRIQLLEWSTHMSEKIFLIT